MLTAGMRESFDQRGFVRMPGAVDAQVVASLRDELQVWIRDHGLVPRLPPPGFAVTPSRTSKLARGLAFDEIWGARVCGAVDELLGTGAWHRPAHAGQLLAITLPVDGVRWQLPHKVWHLDYRAPGADDAIPGVQPFLMVDRVDPEGGATVVASGVHRFVDEIRRRKGPAWSGRSSEVRRALQHEVPWVAQLTSLRTGEDRVARFRDEPTCFRGVQLQVVELTGEPGDVIVVHPWLLHAPTANCGARPRCVLTERLYRRSNTPEPDPPRT